MAAARIKHGTATTNNASVALDTGYTKVEVVNRGTNTIYFTVDGSPATVDGDNCQVVPPTSYLQVVSPGSGPTTVNLIGTGTSAYCVAGLTDFGTVRGYA